MDRLVKFPVQMISLLKQTSTSTISIDDLVESQKIPTVDFIKMDIEGAELYALKGALTTLQTFKPKLAISVYHSLEEYSSILLWIANLNLGYKFHLRHFTIHAEETILFAISNSKSKKVKFSLLEMAGTAKS